MFRVRSRLRATRSSSPLASRAVFFSLQDKKPVVVPPPEEEEEEDEEEEEEEEVKALEPAVMARVEALAALQTTFAEKHAAFVAEYKALQARYHAEYKTQWEKRAEIVSGKVDPAPSDGERRRRRPRLGAARTRSPLLAQERRALRACC